MTKSNRSVRIYSTLTNSNEYCTWKSGGGDPQHALMIKDYSILIRGGAGLPPKTLITPLGVMTKITEEDYAVLETIPLFQQHLRGGWLKVMKSGMTTDADVVAADMQQRDGAAPIVPADLPENSKVSVGKTSLDQSSAPTTRPRSRPLPYNIAPRINLN